MPDFLSLFNNAKQILTGGKTSVTPSFDIGKTQTSTPMFGRPDRNIFGLRNDSTGGIITNTITGLPKGLMDVSKKVVDVGSEIPGQLLNAAMGLGGDVRNVFVKPQNKIFEIPAPFGLSNVPGFGKTIKTQAQNVAENEQILKNYGLGKASLPLAFGGTIAARTLDFTPFGGERKVVTNSIKEVVPEAFWKFIAKTDNPTLLENTFKQIGIKDPVIIKELVDASVPIKSSKEAQTVIENVWNNRVKKITSPKTFNDFTPEAQTKLTNLADAITNKQKISPDTKKSVINFFERQGLKVPPTDKGLADYINTMKESAFNKTLDVEAKAPAAVYQKEEIINNAKNIISQGKEAITQPRDTIGRFDYKTKTPIANITAPITKTSSRTIPESIPQKKGIIQTLVDKYKKSPFSNQKGAIGYNFEGMSQSEQNKVLREIRGEVLKNDPARELNKYFGKSSDTISQQLENYKGTDRATFIQDKVSELGYKNIDEAQVALDKYKQVSKDIKTATYKREVKQSISPQKVYRGGTELSNTSVSDMGISVTPDITTAKVYAGSEVLKGGDKGNIPQGVGKVREYSINPNSNIVNAKLAPKDLINFYLKNDRVGGREKIVKWAKDNGYDGVTFTSFLDPEIRVFNPSNLIETTKPTRLSAEGIPLATPASMRAKSIAETKPVQERTATPRPSPVPTVTGGTGEVRSLERMAEQQLRSSNLPSDVKSKVSLPKIIQKLPTPVKKKINLLDYVRTPDNVLKKLGLEKEAKALRDGYEAYIKELPKNLNKISKTESVLPEKVNTKQIAGQTLDQQIPINQKVSSSYQNDITNLANGKLNVDNLNISKEGKALVEKTIEDIKPQIEARVGKVLTNKEAVKLAEKSSDTLKTAVGREQTLDWESKLLKTRQRLADAAQSGRIDRQFIEDLKAVKTAGTDIGRKLQSFSIKADPLTTTAKESIIEAILKVTDNVDEILKAAEGVDFSNMNQATEFYRKFIAPKTSEWVDLLRYNSMLSSPNTHIINVFSNAINTAIVAPIEKALVGGLDFLGSKITGKGRQAFAGEGGVYLKEYLSNVGNAYKRFSDVMAGKQKFTNIDMQQIPIAVSGKKGTLVKILSVPSKILEGTDQFFSVLAEGAQRKTLGYRAGKGVKVTNADIQAFEDAQYRLYRQKLFNEKQGHVLDAIDNVTNKIQEMKNSSNPIISTVAKFTVPFLQTPMNIFKQGLEYSPAGFTTVFGAKNKTEQIAKAIMGSAVFAGVATMLMSDRLTFSEPINPKERNDFRASGKIPYAVKIGDKWISYQKLPPVVSFPFASVAMIDELIKNKKIDQTFADMVLSGIAKYGEFLADQTYVKSIGDMLGAVKGDQSGLEKALSNYPQQLVPFRALGGWMTRLFDDTQRQVDNKANFVDKQIQFLMMNIPGASKSLPARLDSSGQEVKQPDRLTNLFSPVKVSTPRVENIYNKIQELLSAGKETDARKLLDGLSESDYKIYNIIKTNKVEEAKKESIRNITPKYFEIQDLLNSGNESDARNILESLTDKEYSDYQTVKREFAKLDKTASKTGSPRYDDSLIVRYVKAVATDPGNALKALFTKEKLGKVQGNLVELQRFYGIKFDDKGGSQEYKKKRMEEMNIPWSQSGDYKLEHITPVSAGGDNSDSNLIPVNNDEHNFYTPIDIAVGNAVKQGKLTRKQATVLMRQFKVDKSISVEDIYNAIIK